jgi:hypothetical protein
MILLINDSGLVVNYCSAYLIHIPQLFSLILFLALNDRFVLSVVPFVDLRLLDVVLDIIWFSGLRNAWLVNQLRTFGLVKV